MTDDAELVARVRAGDRQAFAAVYDRYGGKLYDFAYSMVRSRDDAQDAVADTFVLFAERLPQLRDPSRLRPWLYAITRNECMRRFRARDRIAFGGDEAMVDLADAAATPDEVAETQALRGLVWDAAAGLADRDRALLDLHLRQGLEGADLAEAMGVSADNAYVMLSRVRGQMERSLGALLVAKTGRDSCSDLGGVLRDWDGSYTPLIRKRVARHVDGCDGCTRRRAAMVSPAALFGSVAAFAAPEGLRERVLSDPRLAAGSSGDGLGLWRVLAGAGLVVVVLAAVVLRPTHLGQEVPGDRPPAVSATVSPSSPTASPSASPTRRPTASPSPTVTDRPPVIGAIEVVDDRTCNYTVTVAVTDDSAVTGVTLSWSGAFSGSTAMAVSGSTWTASFTAPVFGDLILRVRATDDAGQRSVRSVSASVRACPQ